jgi:hypothetical protein
MTSQVRVWLGIQYKKAGVGKVSGELWRCSVDDATVRYISLSKDGNGIIRVMAGTGYSIDVYKRLNVFCHGGVWNKSFTKETYTDLPTGQQRSYKKGLRTNKHGVGGDIGARQKRTIKKYEEKKIKLSKSQSAAASSIAGQTYHYRPPKKGFFKLDPYMGQIENLFGKYLQEEVTRYMTREAA